MARIVILARHGTHDEVGRVLSGRSAIALNEAGHAEAAALARALEGQPLASIHASPRRRTQETAAPIAAARGVDVTISAALDEIDFGAFTGRSFAALEDDPAWQHWNAMRHTARCPGGETMAEAVARALEYLRGLPEAACPALCVTHCDVIRGIVAHVRGAPFGAIYAIGCEPASRTTLRFDDDGNVTVLKINQPPR